MILTGRKELGTSLLTHVQKWQAVWTVYFLYSYSLFLIVSKKHKLQFNLCQNYKAYYNELGVVQPMELYCVWPVKAYLIKGSALLSTDKHQIIRILSSRARRRQWHPTPVLLPGKSHGRRSLVGYSPWGQEELDMTERLHFHFSLFAFMHWRRQWQPTPVFLPGESQGWESPVGCRLWGRTESDTTEAT